MRAAEAKKTAKPGAAKTNIEPNPGAPNALLETNSMTAPALDPEWCAERAAHALRWLAIHYPECSGSEALHAHQDAAHAAAVSDDGEAYLEALRGYMRAGRDEALRVRKGEAA